MHKTTIFSSMRTYAAAAAAGILICGAAIAADTMPAPPKAVDETPVNKVPYRPVDARRTVIDPHNQVSDEGDILWDRCIICHTGVPDMKKEASVKDVSIRYGEDLRQICNKCHPERKHPGTEGISATMMKESAPPEHFVVPSKTTFLTMRLQLKDNPAILPLDPKTGKITCVTCHNPHERGVLTGRAAWGADSRYRLRTEGLDICQYCHRK